MVEFCIDGKEHFNSVISKLQKEVDLKVLRNRFDNYVLEGVTQDKNISTASGTRIDISGIKLSKDAIQQEMYSKGYRRVKDKEIDSLSRKYSASQNHINNMRNVGNMFFTP